jgi:predicted MFS family arabinose efflux permease
MRLPLRLQLIAFTAIRTVYNSLHRMVYPFLTIFARGLGVDLASLSYALTLRSAAGTVGPFAAVLADRRGRKFGMLLGAGLFPLGAVLVIVWPSFPAFVLALILSTLGKYIFDPSLQAYLGDRVPYQQRGRMIAITEFGWSLAFLLGVPLIGLLLARRGWTAPFPLMTGLGIVFVFFLAWMLPAQTRSAPAGPRLNNFKRVLASAPALAGLGLGLLISAANELVNLVFGVWLEGSFGLQVAALGLASAVIGAAELSAEGLVAGFVDRLGKPRAITLGLAVNSLAALALPLIGRTEAGALAALFWFYLSFEFTLVSALPMMTELLPEARATLMACNVAALSLGRALGDLLGPQLFGLGFMAVAAGAVILNGLAWLALQRVKSQSAI